MLGGSVLENSGPESLQRWQNPIAQLSSPHRSCRPINCAEQTVFHTRATGDQIQIRLAGGINQHKILRVISAQRPYMINLPPQLRLDIVQDRARRANRRHTIRTAEAVQSLNFKMLFQCILRLIKQKCIAIVVLRIGQSVEQLSLLVRKQKLAGA